MSRVPLGTSRTTGAPMAPLAARYPEGLANQGVGAELMAVRWKLDREALGVGTQVRPAYVAVRPPHVAVRPPRNFGRKNRANEISDISQFRPGA